MLLSVGTTCGACVGQPRVGDVGGAEGLLVSPHLTFQDKGSGRRAGRVAGIWGWNVPG